MMKVYNFRYVFATIMFSIFSCNTEVEKKDNVLISGFYTPEIIAWDTLYDYGNKNIDVLYKTFDYFFVDSNNSVWYVKSLNELDFDDSIVLGVENLSIKKHKSPKIATRNILYNEKSYTLNKMIANYSYYILYRESSVIN